MERTRTAFLLQLRVIGYALQGFQGAANTSKTSRPSALRREMEAEPIRTSRGG